MAKDTGSFFSNIVPLIDEVRPCAWKASALFCEVCTFLVLRRGQITPGSIESLCVLVGRALRNLNQVEYKTRVVHGWVMFKPLAEAE